MAKVQAVRTYESTSRDPSTLGQPIVAIVYTIDGQGPYEVRIPRTPGWESKVEAAVRADAQHLRRVLGLAFDI